MSSARTPEEVAWSAALDEYEVMLQHHLRALEGDDADRPRTLGPMKAPTVPMPSSLVPRAMELLGRTGELEESARALQIQVQLELVPQRTPVANDTLPTLIDRRL